MPDLDQLLDTLVADVRAGTHAPGASAAIKQAHGRRTTIAAAAAVAVIAVGGGLVAGPLGTGDPPPAGGPTLAPPEPPTTQETGEASPDSDEDFRRDLRRALTQTPDWSVTDVPRNLIMEACDGDWAPGAGLAAGSIGVGARGEDPDVWAEVLTFSSAAEAADAVAIHVKNLTSCNATAWRTQPIAQTGAVLASSAEGVIWINHWGTKVERLVAATTDGPPPLDVQVEVARLIGAS